VLGLLLGSASIFLMPRTGDIFALGLLSVAFGLSVASVTASTSALVSELAGRSAHGSAIGLLSSIMDVGHSVGPLATGAIVGAASYQAGFGAAGVLLLLGAGAFALTIGRS